MQRIGFGMRLAAALIDVVFMIVVGLVTGIIVGIIFGATTTAAIIAGLLGGLISLAYTSTEIFKAASPGKMLLKLKITNQDGTPAPMDKLVKRWAYKQLPTLLNILAAVTTVGILGQRGLGGLAALLIFIGCFFCLKQDKLALHDQIFGTAVYGAGTMPAGFPVMPGQATTTTTPPPPTA